MRTYLIQLLLWVPLFLRKRLMVFLALFIRPMTLGVRVAVHNDRGEILLVRHTYVPGWHLPGGAVERGEGVVDAAIKELDEECGVKLIARPQIFHIYRNPQTSRFDHIVLFTCDAWHMVDAKKANDEIAEFGFFSRDQLPLKTTHSTIKRLAELYEHEPLSDVW